MKIIFLPTLVINLFFFNSPVSAHNELEEIHIDITEEEKVWLNIFEVRQVPQREPSIVIAQSLQNFNFDACIDLRTLGSSRFSQGRDFCIYHHAKVAVVSSQKIPDNLGSFILGELCRDSGEDCHSQLSRESIMLSDVLLKVEREDGESSRTHILGHQLPQFSRACETGIYEDSWNNAAGTEEARLYLEAMEIDRWRIRTLGIMTRSGEDLFTFGFVKN